MGIENRPYAGTWGLNPKGVVRVTPDALVYINGGLEIAGCASCNGKIDLQKFITAITVDAGVEPGAGSATITMHIPRASGDSFFRDGQFILRPGLEINIYFRGYFPVSGILADVAPNTTGGVDVSKAVMYPYYHCFHGVVTETSYEYTGGEHTASLSCQDMLHFWGYQRMSTSGAVFGARPSNSGIKFTLTGHNFRAMTPYAIIYTLYRDVMGAAGGVSFALGQETSAAATTEQGDSLWSHVILYWEQRFSSNFNSLRMYGMDGTLYNAYQQAFVGRLSTEQTESLATRFGDPTRGTEKNPFSSLEMGSRAVGWDLASTYAGAEAAKDAKKGGAGINIAQMQAYISDISSYGQTNLYESEYETKMNMATQVRQITGFEFYQDVDGDFVFKPPYYNLDTSSNRVYVIKDIDLINITFTEAEPEVTALLVKSGHFANMSGLSLESNEWGTKGEYIDYRLVAKFGWRQDTFESAYLTNPKALFFACISRMDLFNLNMTRASASIPIRPELRPGYPVYLESFDCFYYLASFSHTFSFGGQCTTNLTLNGRRAKFHAPGIAPADGSKPTIGDIKLSDPWLPPIPLEVVGNDGIPRLQGFPNVVLGIDTSLLNPNYFSVGLNMTNLDTEAGMQSLIRKARDFGVLELAGDSTGATDGSDRRSKWLEGPFQVRIGRKTAQPVGTAAELLDQVKNYQAAYGEVHPDVRGEEEGLRASISDTALAEQEASGVQAILDAILSVSGAQTGMEDGEQTANYLDALNDLKASFAPGLSGPGYYRYYSSSHPDEEQQGMRDVDADAETANTTQSAGLIYLEKTTTVVGFPEAGENRLETIDVVAGLPIMRANTGARRARAVPTPTHQIGTLVFAQTFLNKPVEVPRITTMRKKEYAQNTIWKVVFPAMKQTGASVGFGSTVSLRFQDKYTEITEAITAVITATGLTNTEGTTVPTMVDALSSGKTKVQTNKTPYRWNAVDVSVSVEAQFKNSESGLEKIIKGLTLALVVPASRVFQNKYSELVDSKGAPGKPAEGVTAAENAQAYIDLDKQWAVFITSLVGEDNVAAPLAADGSGLKVMVTNYSLTEQYTAVFPVSDERGYEVIGSYRYGRGLSTEIGGNFQEVHDESPFDLVDVDTIDAFIAKIAKGTRPSKALGELGDFDPEGAAALAEAATAQAEITGIEVLDGVETSTDPTQFEIQFANYTASSNQSSQKVSATNAAWSLADMGLVSARQVCSCRGAEADMLLEAFGEQEFVSVDQPDDVSKWLADQALQQQVGWELSQDALRGRVLDTASLNLAEKFKAAGSSFMSGLNAGLSDVTEGIGDLNAAGQSLQQDLEGFPEAARNDVQAARDFLDPNPDEG